MAFLYHGIPENMKGNNLIPLSRMHELDSELHSKYLEKYKGREKVLERKIPLLDCLWNDVVQLLPFPPQKLFQFQLELGLIESMPDYAFFQINPKELDPEHAVVYFKTAPGEENVTVKWLQDIDLGDLQEIPPATISYYKSMVGKSEPVFNYQFVPHIIYQGNIDISKAPMISLKRDSA